MVRLETYGVNREITGEYDTSCAVKCKNGIFIGLQENNVLAFKGIPFAKPPVGELRWKPPVAVEKEDVVREAYYFGKVSIQSQNEDERSSYYKQGEDCLYLNVWTSKRPTEEKKPVMVYIHGGSYGWGGTVEPLLSGKNFIEEHQDVILVTVAYRLGILGFVDFSSVDGGEAYPETCNLGLLDQIEALRWIKENIGAFGGDPENVTIFGQSAGAGSVSLLSLIPQAKGLFQRAIAESGSVALTFSKEECQPFTEHLLKETGAMQMEDLLALSEEELMKVNDKIHSYCNFPQRDGKILPEDLFAAYENGDASHVDLLIGTAADESRFWIRKVGNVANYRMQFPVLFENNMKRLSKEDKKTIQQFFDMQKKEKIWKIAEFYNEVIFRIPAILQAESQTKNGGKAYMYYWTYPNGRKWYGACHNTEIAYVFNNLKDTHFSGDNISVPLAKQVQNMWVNFAKTGDPSLPELEWPQYEESTRKTMILGEECKVEEALLEEQRVCMQPILQYHFNGCKVDLSYFVPQIFKLAGAAMAGLAAIVTVCKFIYKRKKRKK